MAYTDVFTGTNGTDLPDYSANWANVQISCEIQSNGYQGVNGGEGNCCRYSGGSFAEAHYSQVEIVNSPSSNWIGPAIRCQSGASSFYYVFASTGSGTYPGQCVAGSFTDWDGGQASVSLNDDIKLEVDSSTTTTIYYKVNDATVATYTSKSALSGGEAGVCAYSNGARGDNWGGGDVGGAASLSIPVAMHHYTKNIWNNN